MSTPRSDLASLQRDVLRLCTETVPPEDAMSRLGDRRVWSVYRGMVRRRLLGELKTAYKRTAAALGETHFVAAFDHFMQGDPPQERFFYRVPAAFEPSASAFVSELLRRDPSVPRFAEDLLHYEAARWLVSDLDDRVTDADQVGELNFDGVPVASPALRLLRLGHAVHRKPDAEGGYPEGAFFVAVHRAADDEPVRAWTLSRVTFALLQCVSDGRPSLTAAVQEVAQAQGVAVDEAFLEALCETLATFHERRVLLGSRPATPAGVHARDHEPDRDGSGGT